MARVNIEDKIWSDIRFRKLAKLTGLDFYSVIGRCTRVWSHCTKQTQSHLTESDIDLLAEFEEFSKSIVASGLGKRRGKYIYLCGTVGRIEWYGALQVKSSRGGAKRAHLAIRDSKGQFLSSPVAGLGLGAGPARIQPGSSAPTPIHAHANEDRSTNDNNIAKTKTGEAAAPKEFGEIPYGNLLEFWNQHFTPKTEGTFPARTNLVRKSWNENPSLPYWEDVFKRARASAFLNSSEKVWKLDFDWVMRHHVKIAEGKYNDEPKETRRSTRRIRSG